LLSYTYFPASSEHYADDIRPRVKLIVYTQFIITSSLIAGTNRTVMSWRNCVVILLECRLSHIWSIDVQQWSCIFDTWSEIRSRGSMTLFKFLLYKYVICIKCNFGQIYDCKAQGYLLLLLRYIGFVCTYRTNIRSLTVKRQIVNYCSLQMVLALCLGIKSKNRYVC
jgi:hypothetical protein